MQWPDRIELDHPDGVVLRRPVVGDAASIAAVVRANLDRFQPWFPWAHDEQSCDPAFQAQRLTGLQALFDAGTEIQYVMVTRDDDHTVRGNIGVMDRCGPGTAEIGYWVDGGVEGRGWVRAATAAVGAVALTDPAIDRVLLFCDPANTRSAVIPVALGYRDDGEVDDHPVCGRARAFTLTR